MQVLLYVTILLVDLSVAIFLLVDLSDAALDVSAALMWVTVFIVIMQVRVPVANYAGDIFCIMHMTVSIAIMLLTVSVMVMHVTVSSNNFKFPLFKKLTKCFLDRPLKGGDILDF